MIDERPSHPAIRPSPGAAGMAAIESGAVPVAMVRELQRERDQLLMLHEALANVDRAEGVIARLRVFANAISRIGFGRVIITLRDARLNVTELVAAGLSADEERELRDSASPGEVWQRRLEAVERFKVSESYYLPGHDPVVVAEFGERLPSRMSDQSLDGWSPSDMLLVPMHDAHGAIMGLLLLDDPEDRSRPTLTRIRTVELFAQQVVAMLRQAELHDLAQRRAERLQTLHDVGSLLSQSLDERTILTTMSEQLARVLNARVTPHAQGESSSRQPDSLIALAARTGQIARDDRGMRLAVPATLGGAPLVVIEVERTAGERFAEDEEELLHTIATQTASAVGNARVYGESQRQRRQMEALADVARAVSESLRIEDVLRLILRHATALLRAEGATIATLQGDGLDVIAGTGTGERIVGFRLPLHGSLSGKAVRLGESIVGDVLRDAEAYAPVVEVAAIHSVVIVPMSAAHGPIGVLAVYNRATPFTAEDAEVLHRLADQVTVAVVNARLFEEAERHRLVVETTSDAIVITDRDRRIAFANPAAMMLFGYGEELIGLPVSRTSAPEMRDRVQQREDLAFGGVPQRYESVVVRADGEHRNVAITTAPLLEAGRVSGVVASLRDVTEERRARDAVTLSEARYRNLFDSASDSIYTLDSRGAFTSVNEATLRMTGYGLPDLLGRGSRHIVPEEDLEMVGRHFETAIGGHEVRFECRFRRADGEMRLVSVTNTPLRRGTDVVGVLGIARDVTEERARDSALARSEARYTRLVEFASDAIFTLDSNGAFTAVNRSLEQGIGRSRDELLGHSFAEFVDPRDLATARQVLIDTFAGERKRTGLRYRAANGEVRDGSLITSPVLEDREIVGVLGIMRDVTDERRIAAQLMQQEKLAAVGQLVSGVAHELNNPLAGVMAFAELLLTQEFPDLDTTRAIDTIHREAQRAAKIVRHLLTFARQQPAERVVTDINSIVSDSVQLRRYAMRTGEIELEMQLDPELPYTWADPSQLQQVVLNLVGNAEQAVAGRAGQRRITVRTSHHAGVIHLAVTDTGPGISAEKVDRIFNPFYTTKPVGQGTGLGLSISDGIVREHGGRIRVESEEGAGATFLVELPVTAAPILSGNSLPATSSRPQATGRLLVVDDEAAMRSAISSFLLSEGHAVDVAGTTEDARALMLANEYDVVLLDLRMPAGRGVGEGGGDGGGGRLYEDMLARDPRHAARVVFVTGDLESEDTQRFLATVGRPVVGKPFQLDELATVVAGTMH